MAEAEGVALDLQRESKFVSPVQIKNTIMEQSSESFLNGTHICTAVQKTKDVAAH